MFSGLRALPGLRSPCTAPQPPLSRGQTPGTAHVRTSCLCFPSQGRNVLHPPMPNPSITAKSFANVMHPAHKTDVGGGKWGSKCCHSRLSSADHPTSTAMPLVISEAKWQDCSLETPIVFKPLQYLLAIPLWNVQSGETPAGVTCVLASDHLPDNQRPQTFPTLHSSDVL